MLCFLASLPFLAMTLVASANGLPQAGTRLATQADNAATSTASAWQYSVLDGYFHQSRGSNGNDSSHDYLDESFGLIDTSRGRWTNLRDSLTRLNEETNNGTLFKVLFLGRHGQGWHNVAEDHYGSEEWNRYWSKVNTDGNMTWGPDAQLTPLGKEQANRVHRTWKKEALADAPVPTARYSSPLSRAASTCEITYSNLTSQRPIFVEELRETIGVHTCDKRHSKTWLSEHYPDFVFAEPFDEKDVLWHADERETDKHQDLRSRQALDRIFSQDNSTFVSLTAHGGTIASILRIVQHPPVRTQTGSITPVVVKAVRRVDQRRTPLGAMNLAQRVFGP
ncbi:hypothetical protein JCM10908_001693 [Rhodotorula pacifica]|uniref:putative phosphomutase n=1 Tax=Rhodotorula pacifica TaxID=1495444 RepID=UPI00316E74A3